MSSHDWISLDGKVQDSSRADIMHRYLREYKRAANEGVDLSGYSERFAWYLLIIRHKIESGRILPVFIKKLIEENGENL